MKTISLRLALLLAVLFVAACDTTENPLLLNPPSPDSTRLRVVNLVEGEPIYLKIGALAIAADVAPMQTSSYRSVLFQERVNLVVTRGTRSDTLRDQLLGAGTKVTVFVSRIGRDSTRINILSSGAVETADMVREGLGRAILVNALPDSTVTVRSGCQSGPAIFRETGIRAGDVATMRTAPVDLSLYLFVGREPAPSASARFPLLTGATTWIAATRTGSEVKLVAIGPDDAALRELPVETRTEASIEVLNALAAGAPISARIAGVDVATGLGGLELSGERAVEACRTATGDSLEVSVGGTDLKIPLRMDVGSRALAIVYGRTGAERALSLRLDPPPGTPTRAHVRLVNVSTAAPAASLQIGAGAPDTSNTTFPALETGAASDYVALPTGTYPLLLLEAGTGRHLGAGLEQLAAGYYTIIIADAPQGPQVLVLAHDASSSTLGPFDEPGSRVRLFNLMPDASASFTIGSMRIDSMAYSYTAMTVIPATISTIGSSAGDIAVDHSSGSLIAGVTGSGSSRRTITFASPAGSPPPGRASIRILNAVPEVEEFSVTVDSVFNARFGEPTPPVVRNEGRYSFTVRVTGSDEIVARVTGVELRGGRRYVLAIGPRHSSDAGDQKYRALLIQE